LKENITVIKVYCCVASNLVKKQYKYKKSNSKIFEKR